MSEYRVIRHKENDERENHKYIARVETDNVKQPYRYFYTMPAYKAYLNSSIKTSIPSDSFDLKKLLSNGKNIIDRFLNTTMSSLKNQLNKQVATGKKVVDNIIGKSEKNIKKTADAVSTATITTAKKATDKTIATAENILTESPKLLNKIVDKTKEIANKVYDDKDNIYDVKSSNYDEKIKKISETPEWKAIIKSGDPEYVKKNSDGTTTYLIDDYLAKKKNPILDVIDDMSNFRPISINKVEKDALIAGLKQQVFGKITLGMMAVGVAGKALLETSKLSQGSYDEQLQNLYDRINAGAQFTNTIVNNTSEISAEEIDRMTKLMENTRKVTEVEKVAKKMSENDIITAAKILMESDYISDDIKANAYYQKAENTLSNLSEEEIIMLNILLNNMR